MKAVEKLYGCGCGKPKPVVVKPPSR